MVGRPRVYPRNGDGCVEAGCTKPHYKAGRCCSHYFLLRYTPVSNPKTGKNVAAKNAAAWKKIDAMWRRWEERK